MTSNTSGDAGEDAMRVAREVMKKPKNALEALTQMECAEQIMREDYDLLRALATK